VRTINFTSDIAIGAAGDFTGALNGAIGPFVTWDGPDFPVIVGDEAFIGNPNVEHTITGSPFGTNFFRIERIDAQGNTLSSQQSDLFAVMGKIFTTPIASPLKSTRASYVRDASGANIYVFAEADIVSNSPPALSTLEVSGAGINPTLMGTDGAGNFYAHLEVAPDSVPASVIITNIGDVPDKIIEVDVVDEVAITSAVFDDVTGQLNLFATSSDQFTPPVLTTVYGDLTNGQLVVNDLPIPTPTVEVTSSAGGSDQELVTMLIPSKLVAPNGGESLTAGQIFNVKWTGFPDAAFYRLRYSIDGGTTWIFVARIDDTTNTTYNWTVPFVESTDVLFRVVAHAADGAFLDRDDSDALFSITIPPVTILQPNGGETLVSGSIYNITWTPQNGAANYRLWYSLNNGTSWSSIGLVGNVTNFNWTVPGVVAPEPNALIRVNPLNGSGASIGVDRSDSVFTIQPAP